MEILYYILLAILARDKLAAASPWYEFWYDVFRYKGQYFREVDRMHNTYGPIVRIAPDELHVRDSQWYKVLYSYSGQRDKWVRSAKVNGPSASGVGTVSHNLHRARRSAISPAFTRSAIAINESIIYKNVDILCSNFIRKLANGGVTEMRLEFTALSMDAISEVFFHENLGHLHDDQKNLDWLESLNSVERSLHLIKHFSFLQTITTYLPVWVLDVALPDSSIIARLENGIRKQAEAAIRRHTQPGSLDSKQSRNDAFHSMLSSSLPPEEKSTDRIAADGRIIYQAGSDTTSRTMSNLVYYIYANKDTIVPRLREELSPLYTSPDSQPSLSELEKLPYVTGVVKEVLRLSQNVTFRSHRVSPKQPLQYKDWTISPGTAVAMSIADVHLDPTIFRNPEAFEPERWLPSNPNLERAKACFVPFGSGSRDCAGMNFAYAIRYITLATIVRRFDFELYDTDFERDVKIVEDRFVGEPSSESRGVRVKLAPKDTGRI